MSRAELTGKVQTVLGLFSPNSLGVRLTHEHLFGDLTVALTDYEPTDLRRGNSFTRRSVWKTCGGYIFILSS